ncbi:MAG: ribonuclease P protein component [Sporolactobacillus sp.]
MNKMKRLRKDKDFQFVFKHGKSYANRQFVLYVLAQPEPSFSRFGLSVSKKMGNAVMRNHIKRLIKENLRHFADFIQLGNDYIIISRRPVRLLSYAEFQTCLKHVLKKAGVMTPEG